MATIEWRISVARIRDLLERGLSASTVHHALLTFKTILQYAFKKKYIQVVPMIENVSGKRGERGIMNPEEVKFYIQNNSE